jgi:hypothetical protein
MSGDDGILPADWQRQPSSAEFVARIEQQLIGREAGVWRDAGANGRHADIAALARGRRHRSTNGQQSSAQVALSLVAMFFQNRSRLVAAE